MSPSTQTPIERLADRTSVLEGQRLLTAPKVAAFWAAVGLPVTYVPLLLGGVRPEEVSLLVALLVLNVVALVVGHDHRELGSRRR